MTAPADMGGQAPAPEGPDEAVSQEDFDRAQAADRFHNRSPHSPEALAEALGEVKESLMTLEARLVTVAADLGRRVEGSEQQAARTSLLLAREMAEMGSSLARRVRSVEHREPLPAPPPPAAPEPLIFAPPPRPAPRGRRWGLAIAVVLLAVVAAALAGAWYWRGPLTALLAPPPPAPAKAAPVAAPAPPIAADAPPAPTPIPAVKHASAGHKPRRPPPPKPDVAPAGSSGYGAYHGPT